MNVLNDAEVVKRLNENSKLSGDDKKIQTAPCYGVHSAAVSDIYDEFGNVVDVKIFNDVILINSSFLKKSNFIFAVACVCHEMIHYYDRFSKNIMI